MKLLFDFFPLLLFFGAFKLYGIYVATAVAMAASFMQVSLHWLRHRKFETTHIITLAAITLFGGLTLIFQNPVFVKWKPTIVNWIFAVILLGSQFFTRKPAIQYLMGSQIELPAPVWRKVNLSWALFFVVLGILNLYVAFYFRLDLDEQSRTELWVNFKVFWLMGLTFLFVIVQMAFLYKYITTEDNEEKS